MVEERDVVIIGAGIAGMTAALRLRDHDPLVLEADDRVGGRVWSRDADGLAMSVGAHMFPPPASTVGQMVEGYGLDVLPITGSMLNIALGGRIVQDTRPELMPFRLPLSTRGRLSFARAGLKVKRIGDEFMRLAEPRPGETAADVRLRLLRYGGDESFADFLGPLHPDAQRILTALCNRTCADPHEISVSAMAALFGHVWDAGDLGRNMRGGAGRLPAAMADDLGDAIRLRTRVTGLAVDGSGVTVSAEGPDGALTVRARTAICAVPAPDLVPFLADAMTPDLRSAVDRVRFGPHVVLSVRTDETDPMPWDGLYSILTPDSPFTMLFNHTNAVYADGTPKRGSVFMVYAGASLGRPLLGRSAAEVERILLDGVYRLYPQIRGRVAETWVMPWAHAGPFAAPGRWRAQEAFEQGLGGRVFLAGDWVSDFVSMETAALTAVDAATRAADVLTRSSVGQPA